jgi:hypothetical protein
MVTITINNRTKEAKAILEMLRAFSFIQFHDQEHFNNKTLTSLREKQKGKVITAKDSKELMNKLLS